MKAMIFAAGLGSRLKPWTDQHPKALALVNQKTLLQRNIEYLQQYGIYEVVVNVHHFSNQIITAIHANQGWGSQISISDESDEVLETGGGLKKAAGYFAGEENFVVMNADILTKLDLGLLIQQHQHTKPLATLAVSERDTSRYFLFNSEGLLRGWRNVKTGEQRPAFVPEGLEQKAFSGIHVIHTALLPLMQQKGKFSMVEVYLHLMSSHEIRAYDHTGVALVDVGKPESIELAENIFN